MASFNRVILMGNLTRDPEISWTPGTNSPSVAITKFGLAVSEKYKNKTGEQVESVCFVDVVVWRRQAETCAEYLSKGSPVLIEGRLQLDQWTNQQGEKRSKLRVRADRVQFLGSPKRAEFRDDQAGEESPKQDDSRSEEVPPVRDDSLSEEVPSKQDDSRSEEAPTVNDPADDDNLPF